MIAMPLWKRTYCYPKCGMVMDRDGNSAVNIREQYITGLAVFLAWYLARLGPHTDDSMLCADVFTAIENVDVFEHI